jgi:hypothetical protein
VISPLIYLFGTIGSLLWVWLGIAAYVLVCGDLADSRPTDGALHRRAPEPPGLAAVISGLTRSLWALIPSVKPSSYFTLAGYAYRLLYGRITGADGEPGRTGPS